MTYEPEKLMWTEFDFDRMGWLDNPVYKMTLDKDLALDIDYIFKWNPPAIEGLPFTYWIAPATLVFKEISQMRFNLTAGKDLLIIEDVERHLGNQWTVVTQQGDLQFRASGFEQFIRQNPSFQFSQNIPFGERFGFSLERITDQANPNLSREDIVQKRKLDFDHYETVKRRHLKKRTGKTAGIPFDWSNRDEGISI